MKKIISVVLGLALLVSIGFVAWWFLSLLFNWFMTLEPESMTPVAALVGVVSVPVITYFTSRALERRRSRETAIREKKNELYDSMTRSLMRMLDLQKTGGMMDTEILEFFADITPRLITYGSRGVIKSWGEFRKISTAGDSRNTVLSFEGLLKSMRRDLGHSVWTQPQGELLSLFVNDVEELLKPKSGK